MQTSPDSQNARNYDNSEALTLKTLQILPLSPYPIGQGCTVPLTHSTELHLCALLHTALVQLAKGMASQVEVILNNRGEQHWFYRGL